MFIPSIFSEILKLLPRREIAAVVDEFGADRYRKRFRTWDHLVAMLGAQLSGVTSLRELEVMFDRQAVRHYHLNCAPPRRSTLADANGTRDHEVFAAIARLMIERGGRRARQARRLLTVLDSTPIRLAGRGHGWAAAKRVRPYSQGLKVHICMDGGTGGLDHAQVTDMNVNDISAAWEMPLEAGRIYVFDKGYCDYDWWHAILGAGSHFVTRLKSNAAYRVVEEHQVEADEGSNLRADRTIFLSNRMPRAGKVNPLHGRHLRLVEIDHPGGKARPFLIVSDMLDVPAEEIAELYKRRWDIELLFKWVKQNLKIKRFMGESRNAIVIQIHCALIAYILVLMYKDLLATDHRGRLKDLMTSLRTGLFQPRVPYRPKPPPKDNRQHELWAQ